MKRFLSANDVLESIQFKDGTDNNLDSVHYLLTMVAIDMAAWFLSKGKVMTITDLISTLSEDVDLNRDSDAHRTKRGMDVRSSELREEEQYQFLEHFNDKYKDIASVSRSDNKARLVVLHGKGVNKHFHVALNFIYGDR